MASAWSICGMCTVRCPIQVEVHNGEVIRIQGNSKAGMDGSLCPRGAAGIALLKDDERPQGPLIRNGQRGEGKWRRASWDEALAYVADRLKAVIEVYGSRSILFSDRGGPFVDLHQAFVRGLGSPNYCNHDVSCARNTNHAALSLFGFGRKEVSYDLKNAAHVVLQTRNLFEAVNVKEVKDLTAAMDKGCRLSVIDVRATITATKAHDFFLVRPGTDYAFNLAVIHTLIGENLYDQAYTRKYINDFDRLAAFVEPYSPDWAERETGVPARQIKDLARRLAKAAPRVIWHPGWNTARYQDSFYVARTAYLINALLGVVGAKGGLPFVLKAADVGHKGLKALTDLFPKPEEKRADGVGWKYPHLDAGPGLLHQALEAVRTGDPYPVKAYICHRHDPLMALPEPPATKKIFDHLDLLVSITFSWSETAWYSDVVLPLSTYLERESIVAHKSGLKPYFFVRQRAVEPRYDSRADWEILGGLLKQMGVAGWNFGSVEDIWKYQLAPTGFAPADLADGGIIFLADGPRYKDREKLKFKTPSGLIEVVNDKWEGQGLPSLKPYQPPAPPPDGALRLVFGRCALHTQGHTLNNPLLSEALSENDLWIHPQAAAASGLGDGDWVELKNGAYTARIKARVTDLIHPQCVFMLHGFGHRLPVESRAYGRGAADNELMTEGLAKWNPAGGALSMQENFVTVRKV
ncbi:MAG: molybdopterin-dependent oxidoreductase [Thermodesulfobacteriota bacterium]